MLETIQTKLQKSLALHQAGRTDDAIALCEAARALAPADPNVLQLLGAFRKAKGDYPAAEKYMLASLKADPKQPHVHNNLGNLYFELGALDKALACYRKATDLKETYADAWFNRAIVLEKMTHYDEAVTLVSKAIRHAPDQAKYYNLLGLLHKRQEKFPDAITAFEKALQIQPNFLKAIHNLGTVYREEGRIDEARNCFNFVLNSNPNQGETWEALGSLHQSTADFDRAAVAYHKLLMLEPENLKIHRVVNNMLWETGRHDGFLGSYARAMASRPHAHELVAAYAEELALGGIYDQAIAVVEKAIDRQGDHPALLHRLALLNVTCGDRDKARHLLERLLQTVDDNDEYYIDYAELLMEAGDYDHALAQTDLAERINPDYQKLWAIRGDCWRLLNDDRYHWLFDFENLIKPMEIKTPEGFATLAAFNAALEEELAKLHITDVNPRDQTLIGGTQTVGDLYLNRNPVIQKLRLAVLDAAQRYIRALPDDESHPHLRRKTERIKFAGAWSVRLQSAGFHVDHYHPKGWISGPYYVKVPAVVTDSAPDGDRPGWVRFGASRYGPDADRTPRKIIRPEAGFQVFFPSYMWHGTHAFQADDIRMTAPCDIVPL